MWITEKSLMIRILNSTIDVIFLLFHTHAHTHTTLKLPGMLLKSIEMMD